MKHKEYSVSLDTDPSLPPYQTRTQQFLLPSSPGTENLNNSPRQTKSPDNSNTLNMFNNYTDFKTSYKHMLIVQLCYAQ